MLSTHVLMLFILMAFDASIMLPSMDLVLVLRFVALTQTLILTLKPGACQKGLKSELPGCAHDLIMFKVVFATWMSANHIYYI